MTRERKVILIPYNVSPKWLGGVLYISNIIKMLNWLEDKDKPHLKLVYRKDLKEVVDEIRYPYLEKIQVNFPDLTKGYLSSWTEGKNKFIDDFITDSSVDAVYPLQDHPVSYTKYPNIQLVAWYPDLQHMHHPEFFSKRKLLERYFKIKLLLANTNHLVVSSKSVLKDFHKFYNLKNISTYVFNFASVIDNQDFSSWDYLRETKALPREYFMVSNQFLQHKNHKIVLEALIVLKNRGLRPTIAFAGNIIGKLSSKCVKDLRSFINKHDLKDQVIFVNNLSRHEYLTLIKYCKAVIQPSIFEGWSTVIEDAISLQTPVIASDIAVNREQLQEWAPFFDPNDATQLANYIENLPERSNFNEIIYEPYDMRVLKAAKSFISIFNNK